jgi:hypothetical protein
MKIFIQIASYRDPELVPTLKDCISKAKRPKNLHIGICRQYSAEDKFDRIPPSLKKQVKFTVKNVNYKKTKGVCWARNAVQKMYNGEDYTLQIDSHHRFVENWDEELINMVKSLQKKGHKKPLITAYAPSYDPTNDPGGRVQVPWKMNFDRFIPEGAIFFLPSFMDDFKTLKDPIPSRFYSAHFAFSIGKFAQEVMHDPSYYFHGEEISIAVRAFTHGYDLFHPHKVILWHEYTRKGRTKQWDDDSKWGERNNSSHLRNRKLFEMDGLKNDINFGKYGFGKKRTLEDYERYAGISFKKRAVQKYTMDNLLPPNPKLKGKEFEDSFMQIFKHCIDVYAPPLRNKNYDFWAVIFEDENGDEIFREDLNKQQVKDLLMSNQSDDFFKIWKEFNAEKLPKKWVVWPFQTDKGWQEKLENNLY